jgi:hypothetical protein
MATYITGPILIFDTPNMNGRIYSQKGMSESALELKHRINTRTILGELDNQRGTSIDLDNVCVKIVDIDINIQNIEATVEILPTKSGKELQSMLDEGIDFYLAARGTGQIDVNGVISDYELITVDVMPLHRAGGTRKPANFYQNN